MGAWGASITGNDTAQDLKCEYQAAFYAFDVETALAKLDSYVRTMFDESDEEEWCNYYYSLADFMWRKGILTETVRDTAIAMIDSGFGLELWEESGKAVLNSRKKVLEKFREKLLSPQPLRKKIRIELYMTPIFEKGDVVAFQLKTADKHYIPQKSSFTENFFRECDGKWVAMRKLYDYVSYTSDIVPEVRDIWPVFQLYGKIFDACPDPEQLKNVPWAKSKYGQNGVYWTEGSMTYFKRRNAAVLGKDLHDFDKACESQGYMNDSIFFGRPSAFYNADTEILNAIVG